MSKMSGLGLSVLTVCSVASLSSSMVSGSITSNVVSPYCYESATYVHDGRGELCLSSDLSRRTVGDSVENRSSYVDNSLKKHNRKNVQIQITKINKHISSFDFEEEFEEI